MVNLSPVQVGGSILNHSALELLEQLSVFFCNDNSLYLLIVEEIHRSHGHRAVLVHIFAGRVDNRNIVQLAAFDTVLFRELSRLDDNFLRERVYFVDVEGANVNVG